ncbi:MAG: NAD(P)-dependent oxidoreductase, partial [Candidatus Zixiibacteriota bacterium]
DLVDTPIRVSTVDPGLVETEFSIVRFHGDKERAGQTYKGYQPLTGNDIAEAVVWAADRPEHVQIGEIIIYPTAQASTMVLDKRE